MIYKQTSYKEIIARVYSKFAIDYSDWEIRGIEWIGQAIRQMRIRVALEPCHKDVDIVNYRGKLPCHLKVLHSIEYGGSRLPQEERVNIHDTGTIDNRTLQNDSFSYNKNGYIFTTFETGTVRVHFYKIPTEYDYDLNIEVPLVPDNDYVLDACMWYIMLMLLSRGHKHPVYKIGGNDPELDVAKQWRTAKFKAPVEASSMTLEDRERQSIIWTSIIKNYNSIDDTFFDNTGI